MPLLKNELHDFATHNYAWTLSAMYPGETNDPKLYKGKTGKLPIASSGGLGNRKTVTTDAEDQRKTNVEFYIEDVEFLNTVIPTTQSPVTGVKTISFTIQEPYSLGLFMQSIAVAAKKAGFSNYTQAPFMLSVSFKGQLQDGTYSQTKTDNFLITIATVTMRVTASGSYYDCIATPWNHNASMDSITELKQDIRLQGSTVGEVLSYGPNSLATLLNTYETREGILGNRLVPNVFQIDFPFDIGADGATQSAFGGALGKIQGTFNKINSAVSSVNTVGTALGNFGTALSNIGQQARQTDAARQRIDAGGTAGLNIDDVRGAVPVVSSVFNNLGESISSFAQNLSISGISQIGNEIASAPIIEDFNDFGDIPFALENVVWSTEDGIIKRNEMAVFNSADRVFTFKQGTTIYEIIETVIYLSTWGQNLVRQPTDAAGYNQSFRVHPRTYILSTAELALTGKIARRFVYEVYPYFVHNSNFSLPNATNNYESNVDDCVKAYNYVYTGLNRDVLDFELTFDTTYTTMIQADKGQLGLHDISVGGPAVARPTTTTGLNQTIQDLAQDLESGVAEIRGSLTEITNIYRLAGGNFNENNKTRTAFIFRQALLAGGALTKLELTIIGDPYYLNDSDSGNYVANPLSPNINSDLKADFQRAEVFVLVKFNTPVDYSNSDNLLLPNPADTVTGIYKVDTVLSTFSNGRFTQTLTLTRQPNPDKSTLSKVKRVIDNFFNVLGALSKFAGVVGANEVSKSINNFMAEAAPVADSLLGITAIGENISSLLNGDYNNAVERLAGLEAVFGQVGALGQQISQLRQGLEAVDFNADTNPFDRITTTTPRATRLFGDNAIRNPLTPVSGTTTTAPTTASPGAQPPRPGASPSSICDI